MKFATHVLFYNVDQFILKNIDNSGPHVDRIYVAYSKKPWGYNRKARKKFSNRSNLDLLKKSKYYNKIKIIEGDWLYDEDQRNACLNQARSDGMDFLITHDADEFYFHKDFKQMISEVKKNPHYDYYVTPWVSFWKTFGYIVITQNGNNITGYPEVVINLNKPQKFIRARIPSGDNKYELSALCHHASFILSDEECWDKINTWSHTHQFKVKKWYNNKWLNWDINSIDLHPVNPKAWARAIEYDQELPEVLSELLDENITSPTETKKKRSIWKKIIDRTTICNLLIS